MATTRDSFDTARLCRAIIHSGDEGPTTSSFDARPNGNRFTPREQRSFLPSRATSSPVCVDIQWAPALCRGRRIPDRLDRSRMVLVRISRGECPMPLRPNGPASPRHDPHVCRGRVAARAANQAGDPTDPADMSQTERLDEVAAILARGFLRLHGRVPSPFRTGGHAANLPESSATCLELSALPRPDGVTG